MKVWAKDYEEVAYNKLLEIEINGETCHADLTWDKWDGYQIAFLNEKGKPIEMPQWAKNYENDMDNSDSLASWLDSLAVSA